MQSKIPFLIGDGIESLSLQQDAERSAGNPRPARGKVLSGVLPYRAATFGSWGHKACPDVKGRWAMDDLQSGTRNKRGDWAPSARIELAPFWQRPVSLPKILAWIPDYLWPWNAFHMATTLLYWFYVVPDMATMKTLSWGWALWLYAVNATAIFVFYGTVELFWYVKKKQGTRFKYNGKFPADQPSDVFWFKSQNIDNFLRSFFFSIPLWTLVEVGMFYAYANGVVPWLTWSDNWVWLVVLTLLAPAIHEVHFFAIHRLIHTPFLYKWVHSVHHNSVNPSPWSSLSMHPVEGFLYHAPDPAVQPDCRAVSASFRRFWRGERPHRV
jgi:Fatty acid hydroxylase superfamily